MGCCASSEPQQHRRRERPVVEKPDEWKKQNVSPVRQQEEEVVEEQRGEEVFSEKVEEEEEVQEVTVVEDEGEKEKVVDLVVENVVSERSEVEEEVVVGEAELSEACHDVSASSTEVEAVLTPEMSIPRPPTPPVLSAEERRVMFLAELAEYDAHCLTLATTTLPPDPKTHGFRVTKPVPKKSKHRPNLMWVLEDLGLPVSDEMSARLEPPAMSTTKWKPPKRTAPVKDQQPLEEEKGESDT